jgi:hypothetical protein
VAYGEDGHWESNTIPVEPIPRNFVISISRTDILLSVSFSQWSDDGEGATHKEYEMPVVLGYVNDRLAGLAKPCVVGISDLR